MPFFREVGYVAMLREIDHAAYCENHPQQRALTFTACLVATCTKLLAYKISHRFPKRNAEKHFGDYRLTLHVSANA